MMPAARARRSLRRRFGPGHEAGAGAAEFVIIAPALLALTLAMLQTGLAFHAKSSVNYASFEAARAGSVAHAGLASMRLAFARAMTAYYGGGLDTGELARSFAAAQADLATALRIEVVSPSRESFDDYHSPAAARRLQTGARVIPSSHLGVLACPSDRTSCNADPARNRSGQTLADANLLKLRVTWGLPPAKQVPLAGRFFTWALRTLAPDDDAFRRGLVEAGRIPLVSQVTLRMQSDAIENTAMQARPDAAGSTRPPAPEPEPAPAPGCAAGAGPCPPNPTDAEAPPPRAADDPPQAESEADPEPEPDDDDDVDQEPEC